MLTASIPLKKVDDLQKSRNIDEEASTSTAVRQEKTIHSKMDGYEKAETEKNVCS